MLTSAELVAIRRWMGYSLSGNATSLPGRELIYSDVGYTSMSLDYRLANLSSDEENVLTTYYLPNLATREQDIQDAASNLDTDQAAVWKRNANEISDRRDLFNSLRLDLCTFLGFPPGSGLTSSNRLVRA